MRQALKKTKVVWKPGKYRKLSHAQKQAALELFENLSNKKYRSALDLGCGDGKVTELLLDKFDIEKLRGIDISEEMISYAKTRLISNPKTDIVLQVLSATEVDEVSTYDLIFSSFVLQWIEDKSSLMKKLYTALSLEGFLSLIVPTNVSYELESATSKILSDPFWGNYFEEFHPNWYFEDARTIIESAEEAGFNTIYTHQTVQTVRFDSKQDLEQYIQLWYPFSKHLAECNPYLEEFFFSRVMDEYYKLIPIESDGSVEMRIPRVDYIGNKITLSHDGSKTKVK